MWVLTNFPPTINVTFKEVNAAEKSVTMHFSAPDVSGTIPLSQQVAYVLGGVPAYT